uniref:RNA-directed RNA polymerase n=1 Tax=Korle-bu Aedes virus TaxID=2605631 RepID=A0A679E1L3_9VIRU|nr:hypothetical protein 3 [Korle-bu Aedes virus]
MAGFDLSLKTLPGSRVSAGSCDHQCKRTTVKSFAFDGIDTPPVWTHKSCVCNELIALKARHQFDDGLRYSGPCIRNMLREYCGQQLIRRCNPVTEETVIAHAVPSKRKLLEVAQSSLEKEPLCARDGRVKMFLKDDKYHVAEVKAPRCIQYRNKRYCLRLARWMIPIERQVYLWNDASGSPVFAKGRNMRQRGRDIQCKFQWFDDPVVISMDHSKFDSHVNTTLLDLEHWFYNQCARDPELKFLLALQRRNIGRTKNGTKYETLGTRMSGDQNTGLGNCIINFAMTRYVLDGIKHCLYIDGDDFLVFVERCDVQRVNPSTYRLFGMSTTVDGTVDVLEHVEFCQTRPVADGVGGYTMVRNPHRLMARLPWVVGPRETDAIDDIIYSTGLCEISLGVGLPVAQYLGRALAERGGKYRRTELHYRAMLEKVKPQKAQVVEPSAETRMSYETAWGLSIAEQLQLENIKLVDVEAEQSDEFPFRRFH